jgi:hypothetical protein
MGGSIDIRIAVYVGPFTDTDSRVCRPIHRHHPGAKSCNDTIARSFRRRRQLLDDLLINDPSSLPGPFFLGHRSIADDVLAEHVIDVLHVAPVIWISILQPEHASCDVRWHVLDVVNNNGLFAPGGHEDLDGFIVIAIRTLVQRSLNANSSRAVSCKIWYSIFRTVSDVHSYGRTPMIARHAHSQSSPHLRPAAMRLWA